MDNETPVESIHTRLERERAAMAPTGGSWAKSRGDWAIIQTFRDYARGRQKQTLNADQIRIMQGVLKHNFSDNVLKQILWAHANRLRVARFDVDDDAVADFLFDTWVRNQFPDLFADLIFATLRDGNHCVSLNWRYSDDPDNPYGGRVTFSRERWWDGKEGMFIMYGDDNQPVYAVKEWRPLSTGPKPRKRRTIYWPDHFERYEWNGGVWQPYTIPGEESLEPVNAAGLRVKGIVPWTKLDGSPLGIPVVHFANGSDDDSPYGASLLDGGPLAFQDQLNAIQHDILSASLMNGSPQTYSKGFSLPEDDDTPGKKIPIRMGPGIHHHTEEVTAEFGSIPPGDLTQLKMAYLTKLEALCRDTETPYHEITGQWPSGEAIFRAERPIVEATRKLGESVGPAGSTLMHRATEIVNTFGNVALDENALIQTIFEPPEQRDILTMWTVAEKAAAFVSKREVLRIVGYSPARIEEIMDELDEEQTASISAAQAAFSRPSSLDALQRAAGQSITVDEDEGENANGG